MKQTLAPSRSKKFLGIIPTLGSSGADVDSKGVAKKDRRTLLFGVPKMKALEKNPLAEVSAAKRLSAGGSAILRKQSDTDKLVVR